MEIENKLIVTRGEGRGGQWGEKGKSQGTCTKDTWTKTMEWVRRIECGRWGRVGQGRVMREKMRTTVTEQQNFKNY